MANEMLTTIEDDVLVDVAGGKGGCFNVGQLLGGLVCGTVNLAAGLVAAKVELVGDVLECAGEALQDVADCISPC